MINDINDNAWLGAEHETLIFPPPRRVKTRRTHTSHDEGPIQVIPLYLFHGPARCALVASARLGQIAVLQPLGKEPNEFKLWIEALARIRTGHNGYVWLDDWREHWREHWRQLY